MFDRGGGRGFRPRLGLVVVVDGQPFCVGHGDVVVLVLCAGDAPALCAIPPRTAFWESVCKDDAASRHERCITL